MRKTPLQIHPSALGGFTIEGPYTRTFAQRARRSIGARLAVVLALIAGGCTQSAGADNWPLEYSYGYESALLHDRETGCWYVLGPHGVTPRLDKRGNPMCGA